MRKPFVVSNVVWAAALGLAASTCHAQPAGGLTKQTINLRGGGSIEAEHGTLEVPENRANSDSRKISLAFVRVRSPLPNPGPPVFMLAGGPGGSGIELVTRHVSGGGTMLLEAMGGDIVGFDQRGVGASQPNLDSPRLYEFPVDEPGDPKVLRERVLTVCREEAARFRAQGVDLAGYTTVESADDIDAIRKNLGYDKIVLWGESYGSHLALATIRRHESTIARAVLIGPEGPDHTLKLPSTTQATLERVATLVKNDPAMSARLPDLIDAIRKILQQLESKPEILTVDGVRVGVSKFDVQLLLAQKLSRSRRGIDQLPELVRSMAEGDFTQAAREIADDRRTDGVHSAMAMVMDSASGASSARLARIAKEAPATLLGDAANFPFPHVAKAWGAPDLGDKFRGPLRSSLPILMITGDLDPRTPVSGARELMEHLPGASLLVVENVSHDLPWGVRDIRAVWQDFLAGRKPSATTVAGPRVPFDAGR